jgi:hypothetical protein
VAPLERKNKPIVINDTRTICLKNKRKEKTLFLFLFKKKQPWVGC